MRLEYDETRDRARIVIGDEAQTYESGYTEAVPVTPEDADRGVMVQLGFEHPARLLWISVEPATRALPRDLLAEATRVGR
jgi:hypothetical protein